MFASISWMKVQTSEFMTPKLQRRKYSGKITFDVKMVGPHFAILKQFTATLSLIMTYICISYSELTNPLLCEDPGRGKILSNHGTSFLLTVNVLHLA